MQDRPLSLLGPEKEEGTTAEEHPLRIGVYGDVEAPTGGYSVHEEERGDVFTS